jgi:hypothetical protein
MAFESLTGTGSMAHYGVRDVDQKFGGTVSDGSGDKKAVYVWSYDDLPVAGASNLQAVIPAGSLITDATMTIITAFAGGTSYLIGLEQSDGTDIDLDGISGPALALTEMDAAGDAVALTGALVDGLLALTVDGEVTIAATGTYTAGKARLEVSYR